LWQQVVHQVNHATYHRGEVAATLTQLGQSPGDLDLLIFIDETEPRADLSGPLGLRVELP